MLGGEVLTETGAVSGSIAIQQLERYAVDLSFVGTAAVTEEFYIVVPTESKAVFKEKIIAVSERAILVADQTKFHRKKMYKAARLEDLDFIITDYPFTAKEAAVSGLEGKIIKA